MNPIELPRDYPPDGFPFQYVFRETSPNEFSLRRQRGVLKWGDTRIFRKVHQLSLAEFDPLPFLFGKYLFVGYSEHDGCGKFKPLPPGAKIHVPARNRQAREALSLYEKTRPPLLARHTDWSVIPVYFEGEYGTPRKVWSMWGNSIPEPHVSPALFDELHGRIVATGVFEQGEHGFQLPMGYVKLSLVKEQPPEPTWVVVSDSLLENYGFQVAMPRHPVDKGSTVIESRQKYVRLYSEIPPEEQFPIARGEINVAYVGIQRWKDLPMTVPEETD